MGNKNRVQRVCVIDDDPIFLYGIKRIMNEIDFCDEIIVYENGESALNELGALIIEGKKLPDVILLDLNMPIMDGWVFLDDFIKIPNHNQEHLSLFILSSSINPNDIEKAKNYPIVDNFISKPVTIADLKHILKDLV
ncbi:MAG: response regulator [Maribacter sp.]|nr:response regulator [Maribacter sp.]